MAPRALLAGPSLRGGGAGRKTCREAVNAGGCAHDRSGDRTHDLKIKSLLLYQLSYPVKEGGRGTTRADPEAR